jgi:hypothetical protein
MELDGMSDIEGKAAREAASERSGGDAGDIDGQTDRSKWAGAHESVRAASKFQSIGKPLLAIYRKRLTIHERLLPATP